ncbi:MAG: IPT/TIG domain-containing protein, partial [Candidatus Coatesbacteria bacterium]
MALWLVAGGWLAAPAAADTWDPVDDAGATGTIITPTLVTQAHGPHTITTTTDCADWYRIDMIAGRSYHFDTVGGAGDDAAWLYSDAAGTVQVAADDDSGGIGQFSFDYVAASTQTYYLKVAYWNPCVGGWSGSLNYYYSIPPAGDAWDPGDDVSTTGTVLTPTASTQAHGPHILNVTDTADWYQIAMTAGTSYHFDTVGGTGDSRGRLYSDSAGTIQVAADDDSGGSWQFTFDYVAAGTQTYYLKVDGFGGDWSGSLNYSYCPGAPTITSLGTTCGPVAGGTTGVVINGTNLTAVTAVTIGGAAATVTGNTATTVTVTTPAGTAGAQDVVVTTCGGPVTSVGAFTYTAAPTITTLDTTSGPVAGGTTGVVINGTNLSGASAVTIGGAAATVTGNTATTVTVTTPAGTAGARDVVVTTCGGPVTLVGGFTYVGSGDAWDPVDDAGATGTIITPTLVTQAHGPHTITTTTDCEDWYRIDMTAGRLYHFDTEGGSGDDAAWLYSDAGGTVQVAWDDDSGVSPSQFSLDYLAASTQTYYLRVAFWDEACDGDWSGSLNYSYSIPPAGDAWDPGDDVSTTGTVLTPTTSTQAHGPHVLTTLDTLDWYRIDMTAGATYHFDTVGGIGDSRGRLYSDAAGTILEASDDDSGGSWQFTFDYVAASTQTYYLKVDGFGGDWSGSLNYSYCPGAPTITSLGTTCGPVAGGTTGVVINGTNLTAVTAVTIGGAAATVTGNTATTVTVTTPAGTAGAQDVVVTTCGGPVTSVGAYTYTAAPTITSLGTTCGPVAGGTTGVVINGTNLTAVTAVTIGGAAAT